MFKVHRLEFKVTGKKKFVGGKFTGNESTTSDNINLMYAAN